MSLPPPLDALQLTGRSDSHVVTVGAGPLRLHPAAIAPWEGLQVAALRDGLQLQAVSGFRDFDRQRQIWNAKCRGERPVLDRSGQDVDVAQLAPRERIETILLWSALPGASRHHWGSELDIIDLAQWPAAQPWRLEAVDFAAGGCCAPLDAWLAEHAVRFGFYRPYARDEGGIQPEPWHLSYAPVSGPALQAFGPDLLAEALAVADLDLADHLLPQAAALYERLVCRVEPAPALA